MFTTHPRISLVETIVAETRGDLRPMLKEAHGAALPHRIVGPQDEMRGFALRVLADGEALVRVDGPGDAIYFEVARFVGHRNDECDGPEAGGPADPADDLAYATELARHPTMRWDGVWPDWDRDTLLETPDPERVAAAVAADGRWKAQRAAWRRSVGKRLAREYSRYEGGRDEGARRRGRAVAEVAADCAGGDR